MSRLHELDKTRFYDTAESVSYSPLSSVKGLAASDLGLGKPAGGIFGTNRSVRHERIFHDAERKCKH